MMLSNHTDLRCANGEMAANETLRERTLFHNASEGKTSKTIAYIFMSPIIS